MGLRVLLTSPSGLGHIHPMGPLARALVARGNEVLWATPADGVEHVERIGIPVVAAGPAGFPGPTEMLRRHPDLKALPPAEIPDRLFGKIFGEAQAPAILADLVPVAKEWRPDLVVADAAEFAGHIVAAELGIPSVTKGFGALLPERRVAAGGEAVGPLWRSRGLEPRPYGGAYDRLYLDIFPPELQHPGGWEVPRRQLLRPDTDDGSPGTASSPAALGSSGAAGSSVASSPLPVRLPDGRPGAPPVYVTMGTVFNNPEAFKVVLAGLRQLDARILVTVGPHADPAVLGSQPAHIRVERYVSQSHLLPHCDVVVSHGGSGTVLASAALGIPQLCLPQGADQFLNASALAAYGAGLSLPPGEVDPQGVHAAVARLLDDGGVRDAARRLRAAIAAMPSPDEVAGVLEALA